MILLCDLGYYNFEWFEIIAPPVDLVWMRQPRYAHKDHAPGTGSHAHSRPKKEPGVI